MEPRPFSHLALAFRLLCCVGFALLTACSGPRPLTKVSPDLTMEWPVAGEETRVAWVRDITGAKDLALTKGFWTRVKEMITGAEDIGIQRPYGVLHDSRHRLYLADPGAGLVHCFDIDGGRYFVIRGTSEAPMQTPIGLTEDDAGQLYITDSVGGAVYRYNPDERRLAPFLTEGVTRPTGIAFNRVNKLIYVSDTLNNRVLAVTLTGVIRQRLGIDPAEARHSAGETDFNHPTDLAVDRVGQIYVTDSLNFRIAVMTPEGLLVREIGAVGDAKGHFSRPKGVAIDSAGHVYVCDALRDEVLVFDPEGKPLLSFGRSGHGHGGFWMPSGLFIDRDDFIYVADTYNKQVQVFRFLPQQNQGQGDVSKGGRPFDAELQVADSEAAGR
ncbi:SMP-30/gluconolactonase/LRE family protein [Geomesophilobacter sediminis]|uniref:SMP-30/gluconolactonase/LRE family protein n=1 Tax=Geomesophilobacter sediminis TaxID=2798584 RepID=A0A8J7M2E7_9BACT|nr:SMP-30/gluconolactonase/LRE family protein [Geomesophilobacter sediminis]MBJ6727269.1 SMP-30/gluconolactonase/LRE family protein [Geomesophilobacter sediminis]